MYSTVWILISLSTWRFGYLGLCCPSFDQYKPLAGAYFMVEHVFKARYLKLNRYVISESQGPLRPGLCYWQEETFTVLLVRLLNSLHFHAGCPARRNCQEAKRAILKRLWSPRFTTWGLPPRGSGEGTLQRTSWGLFHLSQGDGGGVKKYRKSWSIMASYVWLRHLLLPLSRRS